MAINKIGKHKVWYIYSGVIWLIVNKNKLNPSTNILYKQITRHHKDPTVELRIKDTPFMFLTKPVITVCLSKPFFVGQPFTIKINRAIHLSLNYLYYKMLVLKKLKKSNWRKQKKYNTNKCILTIRLIEVCANGSKHWP